MQLNFPKSSRDLTESRGIGPIALQILRSNGPGDPAAVSISITAVRHNVPLTTTLSATQAAVNGIRALLMQDLSVRSLQELGQSGRGEGS